MTSPARIPMTVEQLRTGGLRLSTPAVPGRHWQARSGQEVARAVADLVAAAAARQPARQPVTAAVSPSPGPVTVTSPGAVGHQDRLDL